MGGIPGSDVEEWKHVASPAGADFLCGSVHSTSHPHHTQLQDRQEHNRWVDKDAVHGRGPGHIRLPGSFHGGHHERLGDACLHCDSAPAPPRQSAQSIASAQALPTFQMLPGTHEGTVTKAS